MTETLKWLSTDPDINPILFQSSQSPEWCDSGRKAGFLSRYLLYGETETSVLWPPDAKSQLIGKDPDSGKDWRQNEKRATEDEIVGWHHWLNGHEFEQTQGGGEGQGSLARCSSWGHEESDTIRDWTTMTNSWFTMFQVCRKWFNYIYLLYINIIVGICS